MRLRALRLNSFRAHESSALDFGPTLNVLHGPNGIGKTNALEAIHYLCLGKSFLGASDQHVLRRDASHFEVEGDFEGEQRSSLRVKVVFVPGEGKRAFVNGVPVDRLVDLVGMVPVVVLSPADIELTAGGPEQRRRFLDSTLSQASPVYLGDLLGYRRALRQRNALLQEVRRGGRLTAGTLEAWDEELVSLGTKLIERRRTFVSTLGHHLSEAFALLGGVGGEPAMEYHSLGAPADFDDRASIAEAFKKALARERRRESALGRTLAGPHRDEVVLRLGSYEVRPFASQGQHRTVSFALRVATFLFLREHLDETPILLLDDVFGALDSERAEGVLSFLLSEASGQSIVTSARADTFEGLLPSDGTHRMIALPLGEDTAGVASLAVEAGATD